MIRLLAVNCAQIFYCSQDTRKPAVETASNAMGLGSVLALCKFSLLYSHQNPSDQSVTVLDDALTRLYKKKSAFQEQKMSKSAKAEVDEQLAIESHQLQAQKIYKIRAAMEVQVYEAENVTPTKRRQFQVCLNGAQQAATK